MARALAYDLGTGGCKAALIDDAGAVLGETFVPYETEYPQTGRHEQNPWDWWRAVAESTRRLSARDDIDVIALSGHSLAMVPIDERDQPLLDRVPIWSDTRGEDAAAAYFADHDETAWYHATGNGFPRGMYTVFKARWWQETHAETAGRTAAILGSKDWINTRLTGIRATDPSYASGGGSYDLARRVYDWEVVDSLGLPQQWWPAIVPSSQVVGILTAEAATELGLPTGVPVVSGGVDNSCAALGAGLDDDGAAYLSLGSSNWVSTASREPVLDDALRPFVFDHVLPGLYVSALSTFGGGSSLSWLAERLGRGVTALLDAAAGVPAGARGLTCVPTLAGGTHAEGGPGVRGAFLGLHLAHTHGDLARALIEGIAFSLDDAACRILAATAPSARVVAVGGGARSALLLQVLSDVLNRPLRRPNAEQHCAALGAAALGFVGIGAWPDAGPLRAARTFDLEVVPDDGTDLTTARRRFAAAADATRAFARLALPEETA